ncbi:amino acid ABC transporter permease [Streptococcus pneumoniae]|nr:amino acid ABC transporter permease [Streptococcus pneumoniae]
MTDLSSWTAYFQDFGQFFNGFLFTLALAIGSFILAMVLGIFFGAMSTSKRPILRILARIFVEFYQNTPLLVQFVIVFYGLPLISDHIIMIPIYWTAVLCVGLYHGAYIAEVIRSGIQSIPSGQMEAALSQGFTYISAMRLITLPQAFRIILPPLTNQIVNLIKNTSTVAIISGVDRCCSSLLCPMLPCCPVWSQDGASQQKSLFTLGGYYGIYFRSFNPR